MDDPIETLTSRLNKPGPVSTAELGGVGAQLGIVWPADYRQFMIEHGGGEGWVGAGYLALWSVNQLVENNLAMDLKTFAPTLVGIGTDGAGELFAYETSGVTPTLVMTPMTGLDARVAFASFEDLLRRMAAEELFGDRVTFADAD